MDKNYSKLNERTKKGTLYKEFTEDKQPHIFDDFDLYGKEYYTGSDLY